MLDVTWVRAPPRNGHSPLDEVRFVVVPAEIGPRGLKPVVQLWAGQAERAGSGQVHSCRWSLRQLLGSSPTLFIHIEPTWSQTGHRGPQSDRSQGMSRVWARKTVSQTCDQSPR